MRFIGLRQRLTKRLRPNHRTREHFPSPNTLLKAYLEPFLLPTTSCPARHERKKLQRKNLKNYKEKNYKEKNTKEKITKKNETAKTQFEETEQESKLCMAGMLEILQMEFKITMINILRALMDKGWLCNRRTLVWAHLML